MPGLVYCLPLCHWSAITVVSSRESSNFMGCISGFRILLSGFHTAFCCSATLNPKTGKLKIPMLLVLQTEEIAQRAEWCRRYAQINSVALRKVTLGKSPSTPSELYSTVNLCGQRHISCKKVLVLVPHVLHLHDFQFCSYAAEHPSNTES